MKFGDIIVIQLLEQWIILLPDLEIRSKKFPINPGIL